MFGALGFRVGFGAKWLWERKVSVGYCSHSVTVG